MKKYELMDELEQEFGEGLVKEFSRKIYTILLDKAEGDAYDKSHPVPERDGVAGYSKVYQWFTEVSGLGLTEQAKRLIHPEPPKREEDLAEFVEN